ncbi:hypothetical protein ABTY61_15945 [Kitasatospora sp. NPDC096128]|uniref:hypothetical protein n=1 Tax=Kitasatospora sp. NPDC096128 TaxID=3155547 RepID=UPI00331ECFAF
MNNAGAIITPPEGEGLAAPAASWRRDLDADLLTAALQGALRPPAAGCLTGQVIGLNGGAVPGR